MPNGYNRRRARWGKYALLALLALATAAVSPAPQALAKGARAATPLGRLSHSGRWLTDSQGRVVMLRGGNVLEFVGGSQVQGPGGHFGWRSVGWDAATPALMAKSGFNAVRLLVIMGRLTPAPGRIDAHYLDAIAATVDAYAAQGVRSLIDFHDTLAPWMRMTGGLKPNPALQGPVAIFHDPALQAVFDNFWADKPVSTGEGVQEAYLGAVAAVAKRFADDPAVFGIDLMNEPFPGTPCATTDPRVWQKDQCGEVVQKRFGPFYAKAGRVVGKIAPHTILFVEASMIQGALGVPIQPPMPGLREQGLSYHNYGPFPEWRHKVNAYAVEDATAENAALLNTEWGNSIDAGAIAAQAAGFDSQLIPWLAWSHRAFETVVNPALAPASATHQRELLRAYARPFPAATAGTPVSLVFNANSGSLTYRWSTRGPDGIDRAHLDTEIRMPYPSYPQGYRAEVTGGRILSARNAPMLIVRADPGATDVTVQAERIGKLPPLPAIPPPVHGGKLSIDSMLSDLLRDPRARAILQKNLPGLLSSPALSLAPQVSLHAMEPYDPEMSPETMKRIQDALAALPPPAH